MFQIIINLPLLNLTEMINLDKERLLKLVVEEWKKEKTKEKL